jgi:hypothetical protein
LAFKFAFAIVAQSQSNIYNGGALFPNNSVAPMSNSSSNSPVSNNAKLLNDNNAGGQHSDGATRSIIDGLSDCHNHDAKEQDVRPSSKKCGRTQSPIWELFTDVADPHNAKSNICKHCKMLINYHKKSESVKVHLNNCAAFRKVMNNMEDDERP